MTIIEKKTLLFPALNSSVLILLKQIVSSSSLHVVVGAGEDVDFCLHTSPALYPGLPLKSKAWTVLSD